MAKTKDKERLLKATRKGEATNNEVENPQKKKKIKWLYKFLFVDCLFSLDSTMEGNVLNKNSTFKI